jgi:hypothetical protein
MINLKARREDEAIGTRERNRYQICDWAQVSFGFGFYH